MNEQQILFIVGKSRLKYLDEQGKTRELTFAELREINEIKEILFEIVVRYAIKLIYAHLNPSGVTRDMYADIIQDMAVAFYQQLPHYDPYLSRPTVYFSPYFKYAINNYMCKYIYHLSAHDVKNLRAVKSAINSYEQQNIPWTDEMISEKTGLSLSVTKKTIRNVYKSQYENIDNVKDKTPGPDKIEESFIKRDSLKEFMNILKNVLDKKELEFFLYRINLEGAKTRSITDMGEYFGMENDEVTTYWNKIINKLRKEKILKELLRK